jgi:triosephosphate isomerase (TIM)
MSKLLLAGNWKMNGTLEEARDRAACLRQAASALPDALEWVLCPPSLHIPACLEALETTHAVAAQDCSAHEAGAYTGELSAAMLRDAGCTFALVGHSERRHGCGENDALVAAKAEALWKEGLCPIVCVGETLAEREAGQAVAVVERQLAALHASLTALSPSRCILAYEPVWAIGTGKHAAPDDVALMHQAMHAYWAKHHAAWLGCTQFLYGGSVNPANAEALIHVPHVDGFLVGGASLDARFFEIGALCCKFFS